MVRRGTFSYGEDYLHGCRFHRVRREHFVRRITSARRSPAALNRTNIKRLTIDAAMTLKRTRSIRRPRRPPCTSSELSVEGTVALCNARIEPREDRPPRYH